MNAHIASYRNRRQRAGLTAQSHIPDTTAQFQKQDDLDKARPDSTTSCPGMDPNTVRTRADAKSDPDFLRWIGGSAHQLLFAGVWSKKLFGLVLRCRITRILLDMPIIADAVQNKSEEFSLGLSVRASEVICDGCAGVCLVRIAGTGIKDINLDIGYALAIHVLRDQCLRLRLVAGTTHDRERRAKTGKRKRDNYYSRLRTAVIHSDRFTLSRAIFSSIDAVLWF